MEYRGRALAAGAAEDEIANALLAIAQVAGLGRVVAAAADRRMSNPTRWG